MADKNPRQGLSKKSKSLKEKRAERKAKTTSTEGSAKPRKR